MELKPEVKEKVKEIERLLENKATQAEIFKVIAGEKEPELSFEAVIEYFQQKVPWDEKILMPISKHLFIVCKGGKPIVKAACGYEFGDFRVNWKLFSKVVVRRSSEELEEIYPALMHSDPEWMELREYICPKCGKLLSVEAVPPGHPPVFEFLPDITTFYESWLNKKLPCDRVEFEDLTLDYVKEL